MEARLKYDPGPDRSIAHCARCGQRLWVIQHFVHNGTAELMEAHTYGWRYDAATETWHPTESLRAKYRAANDRILRNREQPDDHGRVRAAHSFFGRRGGRLDAKWVHSPARETALRLPTNIVCIQCGTINAVKVDMHSV